MRSFEHTPTFDHPDSVFSNSTNAERSTKPRKRPVVWQSAHYLPADWAQQNKSHASFETIWPSLSNKLRVDACTLFDEHVSQQAVLRYKYGPSGLRNGYTERTSTLAANHVEFLRNHGLATTRAEAEASVAAAIESWMTAADDSKRILISISPRGQLSEGYPGYDSRNYVLINVYHKTADGCELVQYRSYDANPTLARLQNTLETQLGAECIQLPISNPQHPELPIITKLLVLDDAQKLPELEQCIYGDVANWPVDIDLDLPQLDWDAFCQQRDWAVSFFVEQSASVLRSLPSERAAAAMDVLMQHTTDCLALWVHHNASNYELDAPEERTVDVAALLDSVWQLELRTLMGATLAADEKNQLDSLLSGLNMPLTSPLNQLMSVAHCITGTPLSLITRPDLFQAIQLNQLGHAELLQLIGKDRLRHWKMGTCTHCGARNVMVGECEWCYRCEAGLSASGNQTKPTPESQIEHADNDEELKALLERYYRSSIGVTDLIAGDLFEQPPDTDPIAQLLLYSGSVQVAMEQIKQRKQSIQYPNETVVYQN